MSDKRYYVRSRGKVMGPFGLAQLRSLRDRGQFRAFHEVSEDRLTWSSAGSLTELFPSAGSGRGIQEGLPEVVPAREAAPASPPAEGWRYVTAEGHERGPVTRAGLMALRQNGTVDDSTLVWKEGMGDWQPLSALGLFPPSPRGDARPAAGGRPISAVDALPLFLADPVGNLPRLCLGLRPGAAFGLGVGFYLMAVLSAFLGLVLAAELEGAAVLRNLVEDAPGLRNVIAARRASVRADVIFKLAVLIVTPFLSLAGSVAIIRLATRLRGSIGTDVLIAGATWLPIGLSVPVLALLGRNVELVAFLSLVLSILPVLMLNSALTRAMMQSDRGAVFAIPLTLVLSLWLSKVIFVALFDRV